MKLLLENIVLCWYSVKDTRLVKNKTERLVVETTGTRHRADEDGKPEGSLCAFPASF
jgi:hypothetical protein